MARFSLFRRAIVVLSILVGSIYAEAVAFTNDEYTGITAGSPFSISWSGDGTQVTIQLLNGPSNALQPILTVAKTSTSPYSWTPSTSLAAGTYALSITQSGITNYSPQFPIAGSTDSTSGSGSSVAPSSTVASAATSVPATSAAASSQRSQAAPTPGYVADGALSGGNSTGPYLSGTRLILPTGSATAGQFTSFEGVAAGMDCSTWTGVLAAAGVMALIL